MTGSPPWTEAQKQCVRDNPTMSAGLLAREVSALGHPRSAGAIRAWRKDNAEASTATLAAEGRRIAAERMAGWPKVLGDEELLRRIAMHQIQRRAA